METTAEEINRISKLVLLQMPRSRTKFVSPFKISAIAY
jgi:hypothetical protein